MLSYGHRHVNMKLHGGAVGDWNPQTATGTDDRAAFVSAFAKAVADGVDVIIPPGNYRLSKYAPLVGANKIKIIASAFVSIYYASDDGSVVYDATAISHNMARSAFLLKNCKDVTIEGIEFVGGKSPELSNLNVGNGIYATIGCTGLRVINCRGRNGASLFVQDNYANTTGTTGSTIAVAAGIVTLTNNADPNNAFHPGMVGRLVKISNATNLANNGVFEIISVLSSTQLKYANASAVAETGTGFMWTVDDGNSDTILENCRWDNCRAVSYVASNSSYIGCTFERPLTPDQTGIPSSFSIAGTTVTLTDSNGTWDASAVGRFIKIAGSTSAGNDGTFQITAATPRSINAPATLTYENAAGVSELAPLGTCVWWIAGGERSGKGNGVGAISSASGVVTFTSAQALFRTDDVGKIIRITDATTSANNGVFIISRYVSATVIEYVSVTVVSENYSGVFSIDGFDNCKGDNAVGPQITSASTSVAANTLTDTSQAMVVNAYAGRYLMDSANKHWLITSNTATAFTLAAGGAAPAAGAYTAFSGATYGSNHGVYLFAGRSNIKVQSCTFRGVRTVGVKISGTSSPINNVEVAGCTFELCGGGVIAGSDDATEHSNISIHHNRFVDCTIGRNGWNEGWTVGILGSRNVRVSDNHFHASRDVVASLVNTGGVGGVYGILAARYVAGVSQPLEDAMIHGNVFTSNPQSALAARVAAAAIHCERVGQRAKYRTGGTLTIVGTTMTLTDGSAIFSQEDVGASIQIVNAPNAGNNGTFTVTSVPSSATLTFTNAGGVGGAVAAGTYRVKPKATFAGRRGAMLSVKDNHIQGYGAVGIDIVSCVAPQIVGNVFNGVQVNIGEQGSVTPRISGNQEICASNTTSARIQISATTAWPVIYDNFITNGHLSGDVTAIDGSALAVRSDMGVGVDSTVAVDHPLLGKRGRCKSTGAKTEIVFAFGSDLVDGDTIGINGATYTYKATAPGAGQFNSLASLCALIGSGFTAEDYGSTLSSPVDIGHIRMHLVGTTATADLGYIDTINVLNDTGLVVLRNDFGGGVNLAYARGEGDAGPLAKRFVVWSPCVSRQSPIIQADNADAAALMAGGWYPEKASKNAGACCVFKTITTHTGTEEISWLVP